jgi:hypothetical protein
MGEEHETLTYLRKGIKAQSINQTNGCVTTIKLSSGLEIHNVYRPGGEGQAGPVADRVAGIPAGEHLIAGDFNRCGLRLHDKDEAIIEKIVSWRTWERHPTLPREATQRSTGQCQEYTEQTPH